MYLSAEHHLLADLQVVPRRRSAFGRWPVCRPAPPGRPEEMHSLRRLLPAEIQPGEILPGMCRSHKADKGHGAQAETKAELSRFRA